MQAALGGSVTEPLALFQRTLLVLQQGRVLLGRGLDGARQFGIARLQAALGKGRLLRLALQQALLISAGREAALRFEHLFIQLGVALLLFGQLQVKGFKLRFGGDTALLEVVQLGINFADVGTDLGGTHARLLGLLGQLQVLDLQFMQLRLRLGGVAAQGHQVLRALGIAVLGACQ